MTRFACRCDQGPRENIEDAAAALRLEVSLWSKNRKSIFVVCDGVGGHNHGEVASALAAQQIVADLVVYFTALNSVSAAVKSSPDAIIDALRNALCHTNQIILDQITANPALAGMATTAVCGVIVNGVLYVAWAGDSRCYVYDRLGLRRLTTDHSEVAELVANGVITPEEAEFHPGAHTITRYLGQQNGFEPEVTMQRVEDGDLVLLCTDGLTDVVPDRSIEAHVERYKRGDIPLCDLSAQLVRSALCAGTSDNITVLACDHRADTIDPNQTLTAAYALELAKTLQHLEMENDYA